MNRMIPKMVLPVKQIMYELHNYYLTSFRDHFLMIYDTQSSITIGDAMYTSKLVAPRANNNLTHNQWIRTCKKYS
jgi:hypothetical protein